MKIIITSNNYEVFVDDEDYEELSQYTWYAMKGRGGVSRYAVRSFRHNGERAVELMVYRLMPKKYGHQIDHINGNGLDNRRINLRYATPAQNKQNTKATYGASKYKGVSRNRKECTRKKWRATICVDGRTLYLGGFETEEEAARAYNEAAMEHFGQFAALNEVPLMSAE